MATVISDEMKAFTYIFATVRGYGEFKVGREFSGRKIEPGEALVREINGGIQKKFTILLLFRIQDLWYIVLRKGG